jgi:hypothetical protein
MPEGDSKGDVHSMSQADPSFCLDQYVNGLCRSARRVKIDGTLGKRESCGALEETR